MMKSAIPSLFRQVEHEYDVRILLAAGYGSRTIVRGIGHSCMTWFTQNYDEAVLDRNTFYCNKK